MKRYLSLIFSALLLTCVQGFAADRFVSFTGGDMEICKQNGSFSVYVSDKDNIGVRLAMQNLANDFKSVCNADVKFLNSSDGCRIVAGTIGMSEVIDQLVKQKKIDGKALKGKVEKYLISIIDGQLVVAGSDRRGTIYGIYEISRQIGVSPWYYWMDVPTAKQNAVYVNNGVYTDNEPAVRYRGIFLNDEAPCLTTWVKNTFGTEFGGHKFYEKVFELILRLKGNYIWPAMWGWAFYDDDPLNMETANNMGVMVGTSHHEPMSRPQQEWHRRPNRGSWDYSKNKANLDDFWRGGVERNKHTEDIITIGMRGDGDEAMSEGTNIKLLEDVVANQRRIISEVRKKPAKDVPQVWALYKEVMDYYDAGMRVPDDVIMLLCDDNWGNVRRVPTLKERKHKGGWGLYYHVDYVGAPRNTKLLNVTPVQNMWEQLMLAYNNGIDRLWILNVGDLKPMEYPIQLFMDIAWQGAPASYDAQRVDDHLLSFCQSAFGEKQSVEAARILSQLCKLNGRCTPEMLDAKTYNLAAGEWATVVDEYKTLEIEALRQYAQLAPEARDAYYQLILFPVQLMANLHQMYYAQAMNNALHQQNDAAMNKWADLCETYFKRDAELMNEYNKVIAGGKWDGMMIQKHIGYKIWNDNFPKDTLPQLYRTDDVKNVFSDGGKGYIAIEAEHFSSKTDAAGASWMVIPGMGRTLSAVSLMPQTADVTGASLAYSFTTDKDVKTVKVTVVTKSTLDYLNKGGLTYSLQIDGGEQKTVNFNGNLNEAPENIYSIYYPTVASRIVAKTVEIPLSAVAGGVHTLTFVPNDPAILLEKIVIDLGGYSPQYLFGIESPRK